MNFNSKIKCLLVLAFSAVAIIPGLCGEKQDDCTRGEPKAVFSKNRPDFLSRRFTPKNSHEATELVQLKSGESIRIKHGGCEYYVITFHIESKDILKNGSAINDAFRETAAQLRKLEQLKADSVFRLSLAADTLEKALQRTVDFAEDYPVEGDGTDFLQTKIRVDSAGRKGNLGFVEFSLSKGPL